MHLTLKTEGTLDQSLRSETVTHLSGMKC